MNDELYHHGIKGMKWGVRRYQNADGSLTAQGRVHYGSIADDKAARKAANQQRRWNAKNASSLSDAELNAQINRLQKEKQLKQLTQEVTSPGRKKALDILDRYGNQVLATVVGTAATVAASKLIRDNFDPQKTAYERYVENQAAERKAASEGYYSKRYNPDGSIKQNENNGGKSGKKRNN